MYFFADGLKGADELRQTFQRIILALHRDQHTVAGAQTVQGEQVQAGRAVDEDEVIVLLHPGQRLPQPALAARQVDHFQAGTGQTGVGADRIGAELGLADRLCGGRLADEHLVGAALHAPLGDAVAGGGVALGSRSMMSTFLPKADTQEDRLTAVVVLPTPPFWFAIATIFATRILPSGKFWLFHMEHSQLCPLVSRRADISTSSIAHSLGFLNRFQAFLCVFFLLFSVFYKAKMFSFKAYFADFLHVFSVPHGTVHFSAAAVGMRTVYSM